MAQSADLAGIPECDDAAAGQCAWRFSDKGAIVYDSYDGCSRTDILLPGFNLLPDWLLAGAACPIGHVEVLLIMTTLP